MCSSGNGTRSVRRSGKYCSIRHMKISESQTGIFGRMERAQGLGEKGRRLVESLIGGERS